MLQMLMDIAKENGKKVIRGEVLGNNWRSIKLMKLLASQYRSEVRRDGPTIVYEIYLNEKPNESTAS